MIPVRESPGMTSAWDGDCIMESERDRKISARAYELWEQGGRPDGHADAHWAQAAREIGPDGERAGKTSSSKISSSKSAPKPTGTKAAPKAAAGSPAKSPAKGPSARSAAASVKPAAIAKKPAAARASVKT